MPTLQIISLAASIFCPLITALVMWGYKSDQKSVHQIIDKNTENIAKNTASIEKVATRHSERMEKIEENFNDLKSSLPLAYVLREDYISQMNRFEDKLNQLLYAKGGPGQ